MQARGPSGSDIVIAKYAIFRTDCANGTLNVTHSSLHHASNQFRSFNAKLFDFWDLKVEKITKSSPRQLKNTEHLTVKAQVQNVKDRRPRGDFTIVYTIHFPKDSRPGVSFSVSPIVLPSWLPLMPLRWAGKQKHESRKYLVLIGTY